MASLAQFAFVAAIILSVSDERAAAMDSARELAAKCQGVETIKNVKRRQVYIPNNADSLRCWGYMEAIQNFLVLSDPDGHGFLGVCAPEDTTLLQLVTSFLAFVRKHPGEMDDSPAVIAIRAMQEAYPCHHEEAAKTQIR
jgi:Rap1a immunity proteins